MYTILAALVAASPMLYTAAVPTFGCGSIEEVVKLEGIRHDPKAFQAELYGQTFYGQCVVIAKGMLVEGSIDAADSSMLLVDRQVEPPGYLAPLGDFELKPADGKKK